MSGRSENGTPCARPFTRIHEHFLTMLAASRLFRKVSLKTLP
ncbi:hypothetical protein AmDm5_2106 [Acetobacter malorum]|nr:hypothetical protein AmDm5_2106 [Acetobacter malorum]